MAKTMTRDQIKQLIRDGRAEVNYGDIETVRSGSHIELRMMPSRKIVQVQVENTHFQNGRYRAVRELAERHPGRFLNEAVRYQVIAKSGKVLAQVNTRPEAEALIKMYEKDDPRYAPCGLKTIPEDRAGENWKI